MEFVQLFNTNRKEAIRTFLNSPHKESLLCETYESGWSCVHQAARDGDLDSLRLFRDHGADMWRYDKNQEYPLLSAVIEKKQDVVAFLLEGDIPKHAIEHISVVIHTKEFYNSDRCCFGLALWESEDFWMAKDLISKFFPLFSLGTVTEVVHGVYSCDSLYEYTTAIFRDSPVAMEVVQNSSTFIAALNTLYLFDYRKVVYALHQGRYNYPVNMLNHTYSLNNWIQKEPKCGLLCYLVLFREKVLNVVHPATLYLAITHRNLLAIDIMIAYGCNYNMSYKDNNSCFYYALCRYFEMRHPVDYHILLKMYFINKHKYHIIHNGSYCPYKNTRKREFIEFVRNLPCSMVKNVSLFDLIYQKLYLSSIPKSLNDKLTHRE